MLLRGSPSKVEPIVIEDGSKLYDTGGVAAQLRGEIQEAYSASSSAAGSGVGGRECGGEGEGDGDVP